jgi:hypothetical protein
MASALEPEQFRRFCHNPVQKQHPHHPLSSPTRPISLSCTRTTRPLRLYAQAPTAARPRRHPGDPLPPSPGQAHPQHHIITWKLSSHIPAALLPSGHRNIDDVPRTSTARSSSSSLRRLGPSLPRHRPPPRPP